MTYRGIPLALFNSIIKEDTLRPYEPSGHHYMISQVGSLKKSRAGALYQFNDVRPESAVAMLSIYYGNPQVVKPKEHSFMIAVGMTNVDFSQEKGQLYRAELDIYCEVDLVAMPQTFVLTIASLMRRAVLLQKNAVREMFWEYEMYPERRLRRNVE